MPMRTAPRFRPTQLPTGPKSRRRVRSSPPRTVRLVATAGREGPARAAASATTTPTTNTTMAPRRTNEIKAL